MPTAVQEWQQFTKRARNSLADAGSKLGKVVVDTTTNPTGVLSAVAPGIEPSAEPVGTVSADGWVCAPGGSELVLPTELPFIPFYAVHHGVYGRVPVVTQSWMYCRALVSGWDEVLGVQTVSFPPGVCFKGGFLDRSEAWEFAVKGRDLRASAFTSPVTEPVRLEEVGWVTFYGAVRRAVHPGSGMQVVSFITADPTVYRTLHSRKEDFEGGVFTTFREAKVWVEGSSDLRPRPSPFDMQTAEELAAWRASLPNLLERRVGLGYRPEPVPGRPNEWYAGCVDPFERRLPLFPLREDVTSSYDGSESPFSDIEARQAYLRAPSTRKEALLGLISTGDLPASGFNEATGDWKIHSVENPFPSPDDYGLTPLERNERILQDMVSRGVIKDERREGCNWPPPPPRRMTAGLSGGETGQSGQMHAGMAEGVAGRGARKRVSKAAERPVDTPSAGEDGEEGEGEVVSSALVAAVAAATRTGPAKSAGERKRARR